VINKKAELHWLRHSCAAHVPERDLRIPFDDMAIQKKTLILRIKKTKMKSIKTLKIRNAVKYTTKQQKYKFIV
jgi:hypothetical protein